MRPAYYNEIDPYAVQWLRNLIAAGHIADGDVDQRSIEDVRPDDIRGYRQCHFFAGIGVWALALRRAGVADSARVWTGSCPCQPFSTAGKGNGFADERHLWPAWLHLISQCEPERIYGEQVASRDANAWIDLVQTDLEALDYALGAVPFPSASIGAPHIRDRLYWVADADGSTRGQGGPLDGRGYPRGHAESWAGLSSSLGARVVAHGHDARLEGRAGVCERAAQCAAGARGLADELADTPVERRPSDTGAQPGILERAYLAVCDRVPADAPARPTNGFWRDADWVACRDGKWRPVEPGTFPLAHGAPARVGRLRAYGNAINAYAAQAFIEATL